MVLGIAEARSFASSLAMRLDAVLLPREPFALSILWIDVKYVAASSSFSARLSEAQAVRLPAGWPQCVLFTSWLSISAQHFFFCQSIV